MRRESSRMALPRDAQRKQYARQWHFSQRHGNNNHLISGSIHPRWREDRKVCDLHFLHSVRISIQITIHARFGFRPRFRVRRVEEA